VNERIAAVIVAAGKSTRFGTAKVLTPIAGAPAIVHSVRAFQALGAWRSLVVVVNPDVRTGVEVALAHEAGETPITFVDGGARRQDSVAAGLSATGDAEIVVVHDGARPLIRATLIRATIDAVREGYDGAIAAVPVTDTLKRQAGLGVESVDRANLWHAQTPQTFRAELLRAALAAADRDGISVTDEAMAVELIGGRVTLVPGNAENLKLTTPEDARLAEAMVRDPENPNPFRVRTGIGYDVHRLVPDRPLLLGGVEIPHLYGLEGHSDADVVLHAISDAVLGACALGDIGRHFPPSDAAFRGISSLKLLERVSAIAAAQSFRVINIDVTVIAEGPKIAPYAHRMQSAIATALGIEPGAVSVKATTNEGLGFAGRGEGIAALAIATVQAPG
jgi:2-C-methyl-D-erythritol 4-phosphate cytidylyltransferase/2-C-methyl-D-erythritol 2,4-cyclodiphosphate synthase